jgi:phage terminase large subunit GpA-like protein
MNLFPVCDIAPLRSMIRRTAQVVAPPPKLTVSEWADRHRYVSPEVSSMPGQWRTEKVPYMREIMDCFNDPRIERVVVKKASRMAVTEGINNTIGFCIDYDPCGILYVQQSLDEGKKYSQAILDYLVRDTPPLLAKVAEKKSRDAAASIFQKTFPGGNLTITGANSPRGFRMVNKRVVICDDVDGFEEAVGREGNPVDLAIHRADTAPNRKIILVSKPTVKDFSRIDSEFDKSDKRFYHVPCPFCGGMQTLKFGGKETDYGLKWKDDNPETAHYLCEHCHEKIRDWQKAEMLLGGVWIATAPFVRTAGFHISQIYNPFIPWSDIVADWLRAQDSPKSLQSFINDRLGETWEDKHEKISDESLYGRREAYGPMVPMTAGLLTAGIDIQDDRIEIEVKAWGEGEENWNMDYKILYGDTATQDVWNRLDEYLLGPWLHKSGKFIWIACAAIDTGHRTKQVYEFIRSRQLREVSPGVRQMIIAVKGSSTPGDPIISERAKKISRYAVNLFKVGTDTAKDTIFGYLKITGGGGRGYMHFRKELDHEYFKQLTAEKAFKVFDKHGYPHKVWKKKEGARNEALDCNVYALAALQYLVIHQKIKMEQMIEIFTAAASEQKANTPAASQRPVRRVRSNGVG